MATVNERNTRRRRKRGKKNAESGEYRLQIVLLYFLFHLDPSIGMIPSVLVVRGLSVIWYHSFHVLRTYRPFFCIIRIVPKLSGLGWLWASRVIGSCLATYISPVVHHRDSRGIWVCREMTMMRIMMTIACSTFPVLVFFYLCTRVFHISYFILLLHTLYGAYWAELL